MRRIKRILFLLFSGFFILIIALFLCRRAIFRWVIGKLAHRAGIEVQFSNIKGNIFTNLTVSDLRVSFPNGLLFTAQLLSARYPPSLLWRKEKEIYLLSLEEPGLFFPPSKGTPPEITSPQISRSRVFPFSLKIHKTLIQKGTLFPFFRLGFFDFAGEVIFDSGRLVIRQGKLTTRQGEVNFYLDYDLQWQKGEFAVASLSFLINEELKNWAGKGYLTGKGTFSLRERELLGIPKINGVLTISFESLRFKEYTFGPCSLALSFQERALSYRAKILSSRFGAIRSEGSLFSDTTYNLYFSFLDFDLGNFGVPGQKLSLELAIRGKGRREVGFATSGQIADLNGKSFQVAGRIENPLERGKKIIIKEGKIGGGEGNIFFTGEIGKREIALSLRAENFQLPKGIRMKGFLKEFSTKIDGSVIMKGNFDSLALKGSVWLTSFSGVGLKVNSCSLAFDLSHLQKLAGVGRAKGKGISWGKIAFDSLSFFWREKEMNLSLFKEKGIALLANLILERFSPPNFSLLVNKFFLRFGADSIFNLRDFLIDRMGDSLFLRGLEFNLAGGKLKGDLGFPRGKNPFGRLLITDLPINKLIKDDEVRGTIQGALTLDTVLTLSLTAEEFVFPKEKIDIKEFKSEIEWHGAIFYPGKPSELVIEELSFTRQGKRSCLSGYLTFSDGKIENWDISATLNNPGPWVFFFLRKTLSLEEGEVSGKVHLQGNNRQPIFTGRVRVNKGKLFLPALGVTINDFAAELSLSQNEIILLEGRGMVDKGEVRGNGFLALKDLTKIDTLHYEVELDAVPISFQPGVFGIFAGKVLIDWTPSLPLYLSGHLLVNEGLINVPFGRKVSRGTGGEVDFDFKIEGSRGIWFRNQNADLELGIDLRAKKEKKEMILTGEFVTKRGQLYYLDRTLQIKEGRIIFDNISEIDPKLSFRAELETKPIKVGDNPSQRFQIIFLLEGTLSQPEFKLLSEPPLLSENDIITYLTLNVSPADLKSISEREFFYSVLSERILSYFERSAAKKIRTYLSLDYLSFDQGLPERGAKITVGKYLARNFYLTYSALIGEKERDEYKAEYYLTQKHLISAEKTGDGKYIVKYQFRVRY
uniref:Translocation and assembly module TamB C-terminal domain-containing protein n=1 Tax=candidate division WOR-3 bacterium TaxID=2052148 RepID=A0A7C3YP24_UNCW3